jgi:hypothetical protein
MTQDSALPSMDWKRVERAGQSFRRAAVHALTWMYDWGNRVAWLAAVLSVPFFYVLVLPVPAAQRLAQQHE